MDIYGSGVGVERLEAGLFHFICPFCQPSKSVVLINGGVEYPRELLGQSVRHFHIGISLTKRPSNNVFIHFRVFAIDHKKASNLIIGTGFNI